MLNIENIIVKDGEVIKYNIKDNNLTMLFRTSTGEKYKFIFFELIDLKVLGSVGFDVFSQEYMNTEKGIEWCLYGEETKSSFLKVKFKKVEVTKV